MKKIETKEQANEYYRLINDHIQEYLKMGVHPRNVVRYFSNSKKVESFLTRIGLENVEGIEKVIRDVVEDIHAMYKDKVMTFEGYFIKESIDTIEYEKILADVFHTSLSYIESLNDNTFIINDLEKKRQVAIYSQTDFEKFRDKLKEALFQDSRKSDLELYKVKFDENSTDLKTKIQIELSDIIDEDKLTKSLDEKLDKDKVFEIMTNWLNSHLKPGKFYQFFKDVNGYMIWILKSKPQTIKRI